MCGIFGYIGSLDAAEECLKGLKALEYRGYDSAGLAGVIEGKIRYCKESGKIQALESAWQNSSVMLPLAIAHTRWATHGKPSAENAHPHFDASHSVAVVHNGIIENHQALRVMLEEKGVVFSSDTDTEVIAQLIQHFYQGHLLEAVQKALSLLKGFWGIAVVHKNHPEEIIAASRENPIAIAHSPERHEAFISSDANAFHIPDIDVHFLRNDEVAVIRKEYIEIFDQNASPIARAAEKLRLEKEVASKNGYEHFMLKEIFDQPQTIQQAMHGRFIEDFGTAEFEGFPFTSTELQAIKRITILACGTSWHAGCIAALMLEDMARIPTQAEIASEFRYKNPIISEGTLVIAISQSGETLDTIAAVREVQAKGAKVISLCNVRNSTLSREADACLFLRAGPEISVCSTKAFTSQLTVLALFSLLMARLRHMSKEDGILFLQEFKALPDLIAKVLRQQKTIEQLAKKYASFEHFFFLGRYYMFLACLEGSLKLKEISYVHATGYPAGEMKHGPIALIDETLATVALLGNKRTYEKMLSNLMEVKARSGPILALAPEGSPNIANIADDVLWLPPVSDALAAIPYSVVCQMFAYYVAKERGTEIDQPRNLAKSVTVE
ncbi:MAG: glutamine--fructose-6-phosphate transaminase (isomerizing) [Simkania sp.]|nr:glutamine--fructose-6-phosphate transaminase (isomerizing) [Simkania sp.]